MILTGKTITQLPNLITPTLETALLSQESNSTYNLTIDNLANTLSNAEPFMNVSANFYSNPQTISKTIDIPQDSNALIIGPITLLGTINVPLNSNLTIL
jgi:hypothetical protein